jgi:TolB-like protein
MLWNHHASLAAAKQPIKEPIQAIVVLPFENYSPDHQDDYIADGITEELTNDLAQWRELRVVARTSAFAFKGKGEDIRTIGQQLNADTVLEGSFTRDGNRVRITAQLNRATDGYHLWSHSYETQSNDMLAMQDEVATSITDAIRLIRGGSAPAIHEPTTNPEAHDLYLQGEYQYYLHTQESLAKAIELFQAAIARDPNFARAYLGVGLAELAESSMTTVTQEETLPRVRAAAEKAIEIDPNLGDAHGLLADVIYTWELKWNDAETEYRRAIDLGAGAEVRARYGWSLATRGRFADAHEQLRLAAEQDPLSILPPFDEFLASYLERDVAGQQRALDRLHQINPQFFGGPAWTLVGAMARHDCAAVLGNATQFAKTFPKLPVTETMLAFDAVCRNDNMAALDRIRQMKADQAPHYQLAIVYALLHDKDEALAELNRAADAHEGQILYIKYEPFFDEIRNDPRYVALEKRVGLIT